MEYVKLGKAGLKVSRIAVGLGFRGQGDEREMQRVIERSIDAGINFLDCANIYGPLDDRANAGISERVLGRAIAGRRDDVVITSKVTGAVGEGPNDRGSSRYHIMREIERSLRRLDTDHVDIYLLHARDHTTPLEESVRAMTDLVRAGKTRYWGVSNYQAWEACKALGIAERGNAPGFICLQNPYSLLHRELEREALPFCRDAGIGIMAYSPLAVGLLSGRLRRNVEPPADSLWSTRRRAEFEAAFGDRVEAVADAVREIAQARGKSSSQVALNWVLSHPGVSVAVTGPNRIEQVDDSVGAVGWELSEAERARLDDVSSRPRLAVV